MFRTWYSLSQIYTTVVIIITGPGMDLYFARGLRSYRWVDESTRPEALRA